MPPDLIPSDYAAWLEAVNANGMPSTPSPGAGPATPSIPAFVSHAGSNLAPWRKPDRLLGTHIAVW
jgi:hypothetical protein